MVIIKVGKLKRTLTALCVSFILLTCFVGSMTVTAKNITKLTASTVSAERGSLVSVAIALNGNPGIWGIKFKVGYDHSALTLSSVSNGNVFANDDVTLPEALAKEQFVYYACSDELKDITANGTVVTLKFKVSENAAFSTYPITVSLTQAINVDRKNVNMDIQNGAITVVKCVHNKVWRTTKAPGCETEGTETEVCSKCGEISSTRSVKANGHQNTEVKNNVAATISAEGYTGDTYCKDCGKVLSKGNVIAKLSDKNDITKPNQTKTSTQTTPNKDTPVQTTPDTDTPIIIQGNEAVFDKTSNGQLVFVSSADFSTFIRVEIDGTTLEEKNYTVASGSTVVTISGEYLSTLADGQHTVAIVSKGGTANAVFTVKSEQKPSGGTYTNEVTKPDKTETPTQTTNNTLKKPLIFIVVVLCTGSLAAFIITKRRRKL